MKHFATPLACAVLIAATQAVPAQILSRDSYGDPDAQGAEEQAWQDATQTRFNQIIAAADGGPDSTAGPLIDPVEARLTCNGDYMVSWVEGEDGAPEPDSFEYACMEGGASTD